MKRYWSVLLAALLTVAILPINALAYARGETGPGPGATATLESYHFFIREDGEVMLADLKTAGRVGRLVGAGDAIRAKWITPSYLSARYDGKGRAVLKIEDIWTPSMTLELTYSTAKLEEYLAAGDDTGLWVDAQSMTHNGTLCLALTKVGTGGGQAQVVSTPLGGEEGYTVHFGSLAVGRWSLITGKGWGGEITLYPYNGKTFLVQDKGTKTLYASEDGATWRSLAGTALDVAKDETISEQELSASYGLTWTGETYLACRRAVENRHGMMGMAGGNWYDPACTQVQILNPDFTLRSSYEFGRQVTAVGSYGGLLYAEVADGEGVSVREYDQNGTHTLHVSADGGKTWTATDILKIVDSLKTAR